MNSVRGNPSFEFVFHGRPQAQAMRERQKNLMLRSWIISGLFFMALPGTLLGFSNLVAISAHHGLGALPPAWMEGHGHAQMLAGSAALSSGSASIRNRRATNQCCAFR